MRPATTGSADIHMRGPVRLFFILDPLVAISNALATHELYRGLLLSLVPVIVGYRVGRRFISSFSVITYAPTIRRASRM